MLQLKQEGVSAQEERAAYVKRKGEEAGTKLVFPMVLLLAMIMLLIMVPAFRSL